MASVTPADVRVYLPELTGTARDAVLDVLIARAEDRLARECGVYDPGDPDADLGFESKAVTLYLDGTGTRRLPLPYGPIQSITSIYDDPEREYNADDLVDAADYEYHHDHGPEVWLVDDSTHGVWYTGSRNIKITATLGYATIPSGVQAAVAMLAAHYYRLATPRAGASSMSGTGQTVAYRDEAIPEAVWQALARHRRYDSGWG